MVRSCIETKKDGIQCGSLALRNSLRCHWHAPHHEVRQVKRLNLASIDTDEGRLMAANTIVHAVLKGQIDPESARAALYGLQVSMQAPKNQDFGSNSFDIKDLARSLGLSL